MAIVERTTTSYGSRIKSSLAGFVGGPILIIAAFPVLFKNEGCAVDMYKSLNEVRQNAVSVKSDTIDPKREGKLVHTTGTAATEEILSDPAFGVSANGVKLERAVEMFQVRQNEQTKTEKKAGGSEVTETTYTYENVWSSSFIDSSDFKDPNLRGVNPQMRYQSDSTSAKNVTLGAYRLSADQIERLSGGEPLPVPNDAVKKLAGPDRARAKVVDGVLFLGNPSDPEIGDHKISFRIVKPGPTSIIAQQSGSSFVAYRAKSGGNDISLLQSGIVDAEHMVQSAESGEAMRTWMVRIGGFLMFLIGFSLLFKPLRIVADVLPFVGSIVGFGGFVVALLLSAVLSFTTIGVAWVFYRPLIGIPMIVLAVGGVVLLVLRKRKGGAPVPATT